MSLELENRFLNFAQRVRDFCRAILNDPVNKVYLSQLLRASASIGANYLEAADNLGKADEKMKLKISRREAKEVCFFLQLITINDPSLEKEKLFLIDEANQIKKFYRQ